MLHPMMWLWVFYGLTRNKLKTYHDVIPISCLTEFPNVVQMAKVGGAALAAAAEADQLWPCDHCVIWVLLILSLSSYIPARLWGGQRGSLFPCPLSQSELTVQFLTYFAWRQLEYLHAWTQRFKPPAPFVMSQRAGIFHRYPSPRFSYILTS